MVRKGIMPEPLSSRRSPLPPAWRQAIQSVAGVAAFFCLIVFVALIVNQVHVASSDPLNAPGLVESRRQFANAPDEELLKRRIRQEDWRARQLYFAAQGRAGTGAILLLGGALVLLVSLAVMPLTREPSPDLEQLQSHPSEWRRRRSARFGLMVGSAALVALVLILALLAVGEPGPDAERAMTVGSVPP